MDGNGVGEARPARRRRVQADRLAVAGGVTAIVVPVLWVVLTREDRFTGDMALIELRVRDVLSAHPPVAGAYSRYGWAHPGPWQFYVFAIPYRLLGGSARALQLTTLLFNTIVAMTIVWLAARRSRATAIVTGVALLALVAGLRPQSMAYGWNVTVTVLPFVLAAIGCWRIVEGDRWALPITIAAALFVFQAHVGVGIVLVPLVLATIAVAGANALRSRQDPAAEHPPGGQAWVWSSVVTALALAPLAYDAVTEPPGNIGRLLRWTVTNDEPQVGLIQSLRMVGRSSSLSFLADPQLPGRFLLELGDVDPGLLPGTSIVLLVAAGIVAHRKQWTGERTWCAMLLILWCVGVIAAAAITEPVGWWLVQWLQPLGWLTWAAIALVAWRLIAERDTIDRRTATAYAIGAAVVVGGIAIIDHGRDALAWPDPEAEFTRPVDELSAAIARTDDDRIARLDFAGESLLAETMVSGVVNRLAALGFEVCVDERLAYKLGERRVCPPNVDRRFVLRYEPRSLPAPGGTSVVVDVDPLTPSERIEADTIAETVAAILVETGRADQVAILDSPLADVVLLGDPPAELIAVADLVKRLAALRRVPGDRYVLYVSS